MDQFTNKLQTEFYDISRPKYTNEIFDQAINDCRSFEYYLDIACGGGQLLHPLSKNFKNSFGIDVSEEQIANARKKINNNNVYCYTCDIYDTLSHLADKGHGDLKNKFDLITIGQALHWFDYDKLLKFIKENLLSDKGILLVIGYSKQHFTEESPLFNKWNSIYQKLKIHFKCNAEEVDCEYIDKKELFNLYFKNVEWRNYTETGITNKEKLIGFLKSWSGYVNYMKTSSDDPISLLDDVEGEFEFKNFYFYISFIN